MAFLSGGGAGRAFGIVPLVVLGALAHGCYDTGDGTEPPRDDFYFPVGLAVSHGGSVLYVVNSDFDLQFNGGTLQSYDLTSIRRDAVTTIANPFDPSLPLVRRGTATGTTCPAENPPVFKEGGGRQPLGETCAPPMRSSYYFRDSAVIGAFATDLLLSPPPERLVPQIPKGNNEGLTCDPAAKRVDPQCNKAADPTCCLPGDADCCQAGLVCDCGAGLSCLASSGGASCGLRVGNSRFDRLFSPVRGNATLTWASVERDNANDVPPPPASTNPDEEAAHRAHAKAAYPAFRIQCGQDGAGRCDAAHQVGADPLAPNNSRAITMPGEPFGMALSEDGQSIVITHQNETKSSLFSTGLSRDRDDPPGGATTDGSSLPAIQFVAEDVPIGGVGVAAIPHDRDAFLGTSSLPRPAFLETSRSVAQVSLLRRYSDEFGGTRADRVRPFLTLETTFPVTASAGGTDSRGIVIDPTPRLACKASVAAADPAAGRTQADVDRELQTCARKPARVFIANRTPAAILVGEVGVTEGVDDAYDPDRLVIHESVQLTEGPSRLYLAPVVESDGAYGLRVFAVCFDSATIFIYDPDIGEIENLVRVGPGPFAMAFDPFSLEAVARHDIVPFDPRDPRPDMRRYRFGYVASFTQSFVQLIDLDNTKPTEGTFERIVFTLGVPTDPKGS